ncbi:MAG: CoA ester lyase, partial [Alphaproteobacteria bacterium]|nr:CoA ester lyase [Alphaproteobacteria bacterium]
MTRPRRSVLYMPGSNARALEKARTLPADALILDLEDAVAPDAKEAARTQVCEAVAAKAFGKREVVVRINALSGKWGEHDLSAAAATGPDAILVPKVSSPRDIHRVEQGLAGADIAIWAMVETPLAILNIAALADAGGKLDCFVMGTNDLIKELHGVHTQDRLNLAGVLGLSVAAARAHGLAIIDGVYNDIENADGFVET